MRWLRRPRAVLLLLVALSGCRAAHDGPAVLPDLSHHGDIQPLPQKISQDGQALVRSLATAGTLRELRWPDFSDYREQVGRFYEAYNYALPWLQEMHPTPQALAAIAQLERADERGLSADDYDGPFWTKRLAQLKTITVQPNESDAVRFDVALTVSLMRYVSDLHVGKINPKHLPFQVDSAKRRYNLAEFLKEDVVNASDVPRVLGQVDPPYPGYQRTIHALQNYVLLLHQDLRVSLPATKKPVEPGNPYAGMPRLAHFLRLVGDLPADASLSPNQAIYDGPIVDAVKRFQERHGLDSNGTIDERTLAELNVPLSRRVRQMQLTLERWRWMPSEYQQSPIVVNIPEFRLRAYDQQFRVAVKMNVVVGQAYSHNTPVFMSKIRYVIFRPYWDVPPSIAEDEIIPAIESDPAYLDKEDLEFVDASGEVLNHEIGLPVALQQVRERRAFVRQKPGPRNSLGLIKFVFPNDYQIYMHDTPATELFAKSRRDFSHGCIRLEKPAELATWVWRGDPGWIIDDVRAAMNGDSTVQVNLAHSIPVLIVYGTVIVSEDGVVHFYDDIYGHDAALESALQKGYPYPH